MSKIMFHSEYLEPLVLGGIKTMTRREAFQHDFKHGLNAGYTTGHNQHLVVCDGNLIVHKSRFYIGEVVAIAQSYKSLAEYYQDEEWQPLKSAFNDTKGWTNKMFVMEYYMPEHIRITNIKVERLQDISDEDCLKEGVRLDYDPMNAQAYIAFGINSWHYTIRDAFKEIIDKCCKPKGLWEQNPMVIAYEFELIEK